MFLGSQNVRPSSRYNLTDIQDVISSVSVMVKKEKSTFTIPQVLVPIEGPTVGILIEKEENS